jgi:hypothetical protein
MADILVNEVDGRFQVTLTDGASVTRHEVTVCPSDLSRFGIAGTDPLAVVEESLRFLLEREPKESIMARFDLSTIAGYFPDYPDEIRRRMRSP